MTFFVYFLLELTSQSAAITSTSTTTEIDEQENKNLSNNICKQQADADLKSIVDAEKQNKSNPIVDNFQFQIDHQITCEK